MNIQTICCILNMIGLIGVIICIVILFKEKFNNSEKINNTEKFGAPATTSSTPYPGPDTGSHILLTDDNGNMTKDKNSTILAEWVNGQIDGAVNKILGGADSTTTLNSILTSINKINNTLATPGLQNLASGTLPVKNINFKTGGINGWIALPEVNKEPLIGSIGIVGSAPGILPVTGPNNAYGYLGSAVLTI